MSNDDAVFLNKVRVSLRNGHLIHTWMLTGDHMAVKQAWMSYVRGDKGHSKMIGFSTADTISNLMQDSHGHSYILLSEIVSIEHTASYISSGGRVKRINVSESDLQNSVVLENINENGLDEDFSFEEGGAEDG